MPQRVFALDREAKTKVTKHIKAKRAFYDPVKRHFASVATVAGNVGVGAYSSYYLLSTSSSSLPWSSLLLLLLLVPLPLPLPLPLLVLVAVAVAVVVVGRFSCHC